MIYDSFLNNVERGLQGHNKAIPIGLPRLQKEVYGIQKRINTMIIGYTGTGKTALVDNNYVLKAYRWWKKNKDLTPIKFRIIYRSMERSKEYKIAKLTALLLFLDHQIIVDVADLFCWEGIDNSKLSKDPRIKPLLYVYRAFFEEMLDYVDIIDGAENPTGIQKNIQLFYNQHGELFTANEHEIKLNGSTIKEFSGDNKEVSKDGHIRYFEEIKHKGTLKRIYQYGKTYYPHDENLILLHINDHAGKVKKEKGMNKKQAIDKLSEYMCSDRDIYGMSPVDVYQLNREISDPMRLKMGDVAPRIEDVKDTGDPGENADVVIAAFNPDKYGIRNHLDFDIKRCISREGHNRFRALHIIKNSWGNDGVGIGCGFDGRMGLWIELKTGKEMVSQDYYDLIA